MTNMGRKRGGRFADRPENLKLNTAGGVTYFRYVYPDGRTRAIGSSRDLEAVYAAARALNGHFAAQQLGAQLQDLAQPRQALESPRNPRLVTLIDDWRRHVLRDRTYSDRSRAELDIKLRLYARTWPRETVRDFDTFRIAAFLAERSAAAWVKHRKLLWDLFQLAAHQGYIEGNPVQQTLMKHEAPKVRQRHALDGYRLIRAAAEPWLQRAMDLALYSLQRRDDLVHVTRSQVDVQARTLTILQRKTRNYANPVHLEIVMAGELQSAVEACLRSEVPCPYLVHARPKKMRARSREVKPHPFAVTAEHLTRRFSETRDAAGAYADLPPEQRPTFHEIRALGIHLYEQAGFEREYIMALSGHATEAMFERYRRDHQQPAPRRVEAGLARILDR